MANFAILSTMLVENTSPLMTNKIKPYSTNSKAKKKKETTFNATSSELERQCAQLWVGMYNSDRHSTSVGLTSKPADC